VCDVELKRWRSVSPWRVAQYSQISYDNQEQLQLLRRGPVLRRPRHCICISYHGSTMFPEARAVLYISTINVLFGPVLRYQDGQQYKDHMDGLHSENGGKRVATVLMFLQEPGLGGMADRLFVFV
jgi:hypothetical protein